MVAAGAILKFLYLKLFHVTCVAYLLYVCAMKVKSHFENVDLPIAKVKLATVGSKTRQAKFTTNAAHSSLLLLEGTAVKTLSYIMQRIFLK